MEEVSTLYTNCFNPLTHAGPAIAYGLSMGRQNQVVASAGRLITYVLNAVHRPLLAAEKSTSSYTAKLLPTTTEFPDTRARVVDKFARFNGEPPDRIESNPFGFQPYHSKNPLLLLYNVQ